MTGTPLLVLCTFLLGVSAFVPADVVSHCPCLCPRYYMPFCASDGKTYGNECDMKCTLCLAGLDPESVKFVHLGPCEGPAP